MESKMWIVMSCVQIKLHTQIADTSAQILLTGGFSGWWSRLQVKALRSPGASWQDVYVGLVYVRPG